jgi:hypothetical protein
VEHMIHLGLVPRLIFVGAALRGRPPWPPSVAALRGRPPWPPSVAALFIPVEASVEI